MDVKQQMAEYLHAALAQIPAQLTFAVPSAQLNAGWRCDWIAASGDCEIECAVFYADASVCLRLDGAQIASGFAVWAQRLKIRSGAHCLEACGQASGMRIAIRAKGLKQIKEE